MSALASIRGQLRALPTVMRIGFSEAVAYRAEMLVWMLATTMPLIMLALWSAVAREAPVGRFGEKEFVGYFLATFIVRQLTGSWAAWQINFEIRNGTLAMRLLRPFHPAVAYAVENLAAMPMRLVIAIPVAVVMLATVGRGAVTDDPLIWVMWAAALAGGWAITFLINIIIGCLALFMESTLKLMDVYLAAFMVFSGYLVPVETFPAALRAVVEWMPFRYQIGLPVELMTGAHDRAASFTLLSHQWLWIAVLGTVGHFIWQRGVKRFAAYGG